MTDIGRDNMLEAIRQFLDDFILDLQQQAQAGDEAPLEITWKSSSEQGAAPADNLEWWTGNRNQPPTGSFAGGSLTETWEVLGHGGQAENSRDSGYSRFALSLERTLQKHFGPGQLADTSGPSGMPPLDWTRVTIEIPTAESQYPPIYFCFSPELERAFVDARPEGGFPPPDPFVRRASPVSMDMLMDVEVPVRVSFGRTKIRMKELLSLNPGSLVELDRAMGDRVEVLVNRCVIARGEVVAVDGNYGVRILEIVSTPPPTN